MGTATRRRAGALALALALGMVSAWVVAGCAVPVSTGPSGPQGVGPQGGVSLQAQFRALPQGGLTVEYEVANQSPDPVVLADGVPLEDTARVPQAESRSAYVHVRDDGVLEVARRTFEAPARAEGAQTALMLGSLLPSGQTQRGTVRLEAPILLYRPYDGPAQQSPVPEEVDTVTFCLGVIDTSVLEVRLQGQAPPDQRVLRHPTRQFVVCSPETSLPG